MTNEVSECIPRFDEKTPRRTVNLFVPVSVEDATLIISSSTWIYVPSGNLSVIPIPEDEPDFGCSTGINDVVILILFPLLLIVRESPA